MCKLYSENENGKESHAKMALKSKTAYKTESIVLGKCRLRGSDSDFERLFVRLWRCAHCFVCACIDIRIWLCHVKMMKSFKFRNPRNFNFNSVPGVDWRRAEHIKSLKLNYPNECWFVASCCVIFPLFYLFHISRRSCFIWTGMDRRTKSSLYLS